MGTDVPQERGGVNDGFILVAEDHHPTVELAISMTRADDSENDEASLPPGSQRIRKQAIRDLTVPRVDAALGTLLDVRKHECFQLHTASLENGRKARFFPTTLL